jgi:outer membrane biosynthesis protein TonB
LRAIITLIGYFTADYLKKLKIKVLALSLPKKKRHIAFPVLEESLAVMKMLKKSLLTLCLLVGCSLAAFGQSNNPPPKPNPPTVPVEPKKPKPTPKPTPKPESQLVTEIFKQD